MPPCTRRAALSLFAAALAMPGAHRAAAGSGLPLPRFASLRAGEVNVRTGPGVRYPVEWVFVYRNMPVEIVAEFDTWRKIRDWEGIEGWVHQSMLSGRRTIMIRTGPQAMRREPDETAPLVARIEAKVIGRLQQCRDGWCRVEVSGFTGWMRRDQFWGVYADEVIR